MLDALLRSEEQRNPWRWGSEGQDGGVGSRDGTGASVLGCWGDKCLNVIVDCFKQQVFQTKSVVPLLHPKYTEQTI